MERCACCGKELSRDEIGLYKKIVNRGAVSFSCLPCLAARFEVPAELLEEKIRQFREEGCTLFL